VLRFITQTMTMLLLILGLCVGYLYWQYERFLETPLTLPQGGYPLLVESGANLRGLAEQLHRDGVLKPGWMLRLLAKLDGSEVKIKHGEYRLSGEMRPRDLLQVLVEGKVIAHAITIIEGWRFRDLRSALAADARIQQTLGGLSDEAVMQRLGHPGEHPEGRFLPETYHFTRGMSDAQILTRAYDAMAQLLEQEWATRDPVGVLESPYQALILASIVEKETGVASERPAIAGVFIRRLGKGMLLQTDPTVIYGMGEAYDGNIRRADLRRDTPYNTYTREGLPPTPIALPGAEAVRAALHPAAGDSLYFVAKGDGSHYFSATLEEHNRAVRKYQLKR